MKILLPTIRDAGQIGGTTTHISMLARGLEETGHEVHALYLGAKVPGIVRNAGVVWPAGALNRLRNGWGMVYAAEARGRLLAGVTEEELAKATPPWEVLNAQEVYSIPYLRAVADKHGIPLVLTLHGYPLFESVSEGYSTSSEMGRNFLMRSEMRALRLADAVVTVDTRLFRHALKLVPERSASIYTLMNFIDTSVFAPLEDAAEEVRLRAELRKKWDVRQDKIVLFCPRRLVKKNGVIYPSLALAAMDLADRDRFVLVHAGEGGEQGEMERIIRENALDRNVRLLGGQDRDAILELYRLTDIVLVPSVHSENVEEATSLSALEAMACGRPLIAGDVGGLAEMVEDGGTGLLVPADAGALAAAILRLAGNPDLGARMAVAARTYVVERHSHLRAAASYAEIYATASEDLAKRSAGGDDLAEKRVAAGGPTPGGATLAGPGVVALGAQLPRPISVQGYPLHAVTLEEAAQWVVAAAVEPLAAGAPAYTRSAVSFNPELVIRAQHDPDAAEALLEADLCYPDGVGAVWAAGRQGAAHVERVPGIDLAQRVLELAADRGLPVYFLGAAEGVAAEAARVQKDRLPGLQVAGTHHGYFSPAEDVEVVRLVKESGAQILLVAMGAPRQEILLHRHRDELGAAVGLGIGGSFDVWAGSVKRAPEWAQRAKVEWLYRLMADPRRARRQTVLLRYAAQVVRGSADDYGPPRRGRARAAVPPDADGGS
jgi:exopolysaccharide biosynthesis WecB/TagA/CpsF family protein